KIIAAGKFVTRNGNVTSDSVGSCAPALDADASTSFDGGCSQSAPSCDEPGDGDLRSTALCLGGRNFPTPNLGGIQLARFESARLMGTSLRLGKVANPGLPEVTTRSMVVGSTPPGPGPLPPTHGHCGRPISRPGVPMGSGSGPLWRPKTVVWAHSAQGAVWPFHGLPIWCIHFLLARS
ncbi:hypothetical protein THAOC_19673, partial [Thalassiosira oceanica]